MKRFKIGEPIRFGVRDDGGLLGANADDFKCYYAPLLDVKNETEIEGKFLDDKPFFWTPIFYLFSTGKYVIHIVNDNDDINIKEVFEVTNELHDSNDSEIII